jgi:hypothetical protein
VAEGYQNCYPCAQQSRSTDLTADAVVPISYALKGTQHAHNLASYKFKRPSQGANRALLALGLVFLRWHRPCLEDRAGGPLTHLTVVPSTRRRPGQHPLLALLGPHTSLPALQASDTGIYPPEDRMFHPDRFSAQMTAAGARILLLDDTWTTGARVQSLSHTFKSAGAQAVVAVVLGRHLNSAHDGSKALVDKARRDTFDIRRCASED